MLRERIRSYLTQVEAIVRALPVADIESACDLLGAARRDNRMIFLAGNGGSAATAAHLACDMAKGPANSSTLRLRAFSLTEGIPLLTAWSNDASYEDALANHLSTVAMPGDVLIAISSSGNSPNVIAAAAAARAAGMVTIALTGSDGGKLRELVDLSVRVPAERCEHVEDAHLILGHLICDALRGELLAERCQEGGTR